jgi:2-haloacid dehalogenase
VDFTGVRWLSFDCYGTLIDWERGILGALRRVLARHAAAVDDGTLLAAYARAERDLEAGPYQPYRRVLDAVMERLATEFRFPLSSLSERRALSESLGQWDAFPETAAALAALQKRFRLAVISNVDNDLFAGTAPKLGVRPDAFVSAQQCRTYKPSLNNFRVAMERMGAGPGDLMHVAESLYHDIAPARELGIRCVWVNRRGSAGPGASGSASATPDLEVPDLATLAALVARDRGSTR